MTTKEITENLTRISSELKILIQEIIETDLIDNVELSVREARCQISEALIFIDKYVCPNDIKSAPPPQLIQITFPNTADEEHQSYYSVPNSCDEIRIDFKNGEMASITWFQIIKNGKVIAEIKESVCNKYYK
jgi:hypothetical protein